MQKTIRIIAILSTVLIGLSLILLLASLLFQGSVARFLLKAPEEIVEALPHFPTIPFMNCFLCAICAILLIVCCGNKKGGIWLEVIVLICLMIVLPAILGIASYVNVLMIGNFKGEIYFAAENTVSRIFNLCMIPYNLGRALAFVACGMSIVYKKMCKNAQ